MVSLVPERDVWVPLRAAEQALDPRQQHGQVEWLGKVVVRARLETIHHVFGQTLGGEHQEGRAIAGQARGACHRQPVHVGQHDFGA